MRSCNLGGICSFSEQAADEACDRSSNQDVRHNGARHSYDQELSDVKRTQNEKLVRGVEHDRHDEYSADIFYCGSEKPATLGGIREESSQEGWPPFAGVPQIGAYRKNGDYGRHHEQAKVQRPARPAEQFIDSAGNQLPDRIHGPLSPILQPSASHACRLHVFGYFRLHIHGEHRAGQHAAGDGSRFEPILQKNARRVVGALR